MPLYPAIVESYDGERRRARIAIPGMTDGSNVYPEAELMYSLGDSHNDTEIEIEAGDKVWIDFLIDGDWRYPVIVGYRQPETGNLVSIRRWRQKRIELIADHVLIDCKTMEVTGDVTIKGFLSILKTLTVALLTQLLSGLIVTGTMTNNDKNVGSTHKHRENGDGGGTTDEPF
ncbi:hypothetical protein ADP71_14280 [Vitreoscilla sp. C1]|uniref:hypothetical protein n=1 Tax=Vitreoscilla sp. (strain C1) TaxID=96942 RepID=UPI000CDBAD0D|nr:hypothetical protein [Vitreoscilla sp. C1]AUZ05036.1 hypothetical protein ADP71_14280 [Vitreoscilla sp. C1]